MYFHIILFETINDIWGPFTEFFSYAQDTSWVDAILADQLRHLYQALMVENNDGIREQIIQVGSELPL